MREIKPIISVADMKQFAKIAYYAYTGVGSTYEDRYERMSKINTNDKNSMFYVAKENGKTVAGMRLIDYKMNYRNKFIDTCGVGMVAVDLGYKKMGLAKDLIKFYLNKCKNNNQSVAILYPFRPDFYNKMGFGYGSPNYEYSFNPHSLPNTNSRDGWCFLSKDDLPLIADCYKRVAEKQHGYCLRSAYELEGYKERFKGNGISFGFKKNGRLEAYLFFTSKKDSQTNFLQNYIKIHEFIYTCPEALQSVFNFLHVQADQYSRIEFETQSSDFHFCLKDIRHTDLLVTPKIAHKSAVAAVGMMYRIVDVEMFLNILSKQYTFDCKDMNIALTIEDTFMPTNNKSYCFKLKDGKLELSDNINNAINISINIADFSSLMMGSVSLSSLYKYGKAICNETDINKLNTFFNINDIPQCTTLF